MKRILSLISVLVLSGCTTVDDFIAISPEQRAEKACSNITEFKQANNALNALVHKYAEIKMDLKRGYKIHKNCRSVQVPGNVQTNCYQTFMGVQCNSVAIPSYETVCDEIPVAINPELEKQKLQEISQYYSMIKDDLSKKYNDCFNSVLRMNPEQAFSVWKSRTYPH